MTRPSCANPERGPLMNRSALVGSQMVLALVLGGSLGAQSATLERGTRIRVTMGGAVSKPFVGVVDSVVGDTIRLQTAFQAGASVPLASVWRLEVFSGRRRPMWAKLAPLWATGVGFGVGALIGHAAAQEEGTNYEPGFAEAAWGGIFGVAGLVAGTGVAIGIKSDHWTTVARPAVTGHAAPVPSIYAASWHRGVKLGVRAAF
jgi:hypothetical protein